MGAGLFGYLGYDMIRQVETLASDLPDPIGTPDAIMVRPTIVAIFDAVAQKAKDYILKGDIFQVVIGQRLSAPLPASDFALYRSLRRMNPSPFLYFLNFEDHSIIGSSPEILVRLPSQARARAGKHRHKIYSTRKTSSQIRKNAQNISCCWI